MNIKSEKDFLSGLLFMGAGLTFAWGASDYAIGTAERMGPGYVPLLLGIVLVLLGGVITFKALVVETVDGNKIGRIAWRPLASIIAANLVFGVALGGLPVIRLPPMGLMAGVFLSTIIASYAGSKFRPIEVLVLATVLSILSYFAFIVLLKLQLPVWPAF